MADDPSESISEAIHQGDSEGLKSLIETFGLSHLDAWSTGYYFLCEALEAQKPEMAKLLLMSGAKVNGDWREDFVNPPLSIAVACNYIEIVPMLLERNAEVDALDDYSETALYIAANRGYLEIVKQLLEYNASIEAQTDDVDSPFLAAVYSGKIEIAKELLNYGLRVKNADTEWIDKKCTPLHLAVFQQDESGVNLFLNKGADIESKMTNGMTPLHIATTFKDEKIIELLLKRGANVNAGEEYCQTALHLAVEFGCTDVVKVLLANRANVNTEQKSSFAPLLLDSAANINARDSDGSTALHIASQLGLLDVVELLLERNADLEAKNNEGETALYVATKFGRPSVVRALLDRDADFNITPPFHRPVSILEYAFYRVDLIEGLMGEFDGFIDEFDEFGTLRDFQEVTQILAKNIITKAVMQSYVSKENLKAINDREIYRRILENLQTEVMDMKTKKIGDSTVSFFNVLVAERHHLANYARNDSIVEAIASNDSSGEFPTFWNIITHRIETGQKRKKLLDSSLKSLTNLFGYALPNVFAIELGQYLSNKDLENLVTAYPIQKNGPSH